MLRLQLQETAVVRKSMPGGVRGGARKESPYSIWPDDGGNELAIVARDERISNVGGAGEPCSTLESDTGSKLS